MYGWPAANDTARSSARGSNAVPLTAAVSTNPRSISASSTGPTRGCWQRARNVGSARRSDVGRPASTTANGSRWRCRCWTALPSSSSVASEALWISSIDSSTPLRSAATSRSSTSRTDVMRVCGVTASTLMWAPPAPTSVTRRFAGGRSSARRARARSTMRAASGGPAPASSCSTHQPAAVARSWISSSSTVLPAPRWARRSTAQWTLRASNRWNTPRIRSITSPRPTITGGCEPKPGVNGLPSIRTI